MAGVAVAPPAARQARASGSQGSPPLWSPASPAWALDASRCLALPPFFARRGAGGLGAAALGVLGALRAARRPRGRRPARHLPRPARAAAANVTEDVVWEESYRVYIEDTDCFQVVFYANYLRFFRRLLARAHARLGRGPPAVVGVERGRYSRAARLGDQLRVSARELGEGGGCRRWALSSETSAGPCVSAELLVAEVGEGGAGRWGGPGPSWPPAPPSEPGPPTVISAFEEFARPAPSAVDVLRWFERSRTDSLGGPQNLERLQSDLGVMVVVARLEEFACDPAAAAEHLQGASSDAGRDVFHVRSSLELRRRNTQIVFDQRLHGVGVGVGRCLARALVTCLCVDAKSLRIIPCPEDVVRRLHGWREQGVQGDLAATGG
uniref:Thioesterase domain-containing protein n=1 Tax=Alexandrium monilatum TaxID=311494 RepID=A0A7S4T336_9DINO